MREQAVRTVISAVTIRSRVSGTFFVAGFGTIWLLTGLAGMGHLHVATGSAAIFAGVCTIAAGLALLRFADRFPSLPLPPEEARRQRLLFNAVNIIQWVAIGTAITVLAILHLPEYIVPTIGIIVGLHLYPLAGAFRYFLHYVTATVLVLWCSACIALLSPVRLSGVSAFGTGAILLLSGMTTLGLTYIKARRSSAP